MAEKLDPNEIVTLEELAISSMWETAVQSQAVPFISGAMVSLEIQVSVALCSRFAGFSCPDTLGYHPKRIQMLEDR